MRPQPLLRAGRPMAVGALGFATLAAGTSAVALAQNNHQDVITVKKARTPGAGPTSSGSSPASRRSTCAPAMASSASGPCPTSRAQRTRLSAANRPLP